MWSWCLRFLRNCTAERAAENTRNKLRLCQYSQKVLGETVAETAIDYDRNTRGILFLYRDAQSFDAGVKHMKILEDGGQKFHVLDFAGLIQVDPALAAARGKIHGGLHGPTDESGDCHKFTNALAEICRAPGTRALAATMMAESAAVAEKLGLRLRVSIEQRIEGAAKVGDHKTSMLQDAEAGRPLEVEPLIGAFVELGELTDTPMPATRAVYALISLLDARLRGAT